MAWPVTDFDGVKFNAGSGWAEVVAIHLGIKERADAVGHSLASGDYADEWDTATKVWLGDPSDASAGDGRTYLRDVLSGFYADILSLLDDDADIRWTETGSAGSAEWTEASLVAAIAMGDFADLLTKPANHEPFLWLHEALDRLVYARIYVQSGNYTTGATVSSRSNTEATLQDAWNHRTDVVGSGAGGFGAAWGITAAPRGFLNYGYTFPFDLSAYSGTVVDGEWRLFYFNESTITVTVTYGATALVITPGSTSGGQIWHPWGGVELATGTTTNKITGFATAEPYVVPFSSNPASVGFNTDATAFDKRAGARVYIDLSTILADQA